MKNIKKILNALLLSSVLSLNACSSTAVKDSLNKSASSVPHEKPTVTEVAEETPEPTATATNTPTAANISLSDIPVYSGQPYVAINGNNPYFQDSDLVTTSYEHYSDLDSLGRCGVAVANVGKDLMPTEKRGSIGMIKPSGWKTVRYDNVDGGYLYNRCHLIGYQLTAENANEKNLITGTRYLNIEGMLPFENMTADYIKETGNHVLYRVTPIFDGNNLVASGVLMEGKSVEDNGKGVQFCVYCYNVQPGITIDYATGDSSQDSTYTATSEPAPTATPAPQQVQQPEQSGDVYIGNANTKKFHHSWCSSVKQMKDSNKVTFTNRDDAINAGYEPCKRCNP